MERELDIIDESSKFSIGNNFLLNNLYFNYRKKFGYDHIFYFFSTEGVSFEGLEEGYWIVNNRPYKYCLRVSSSEVLDYQKLFYGSGFEFFYSIRVTRSEIRRLIFWDFINLLVFLKIELFILFFGFFFFCFFIVYPYL